MTDAIAFFDHIANLLVLRPGVSRSKMFGMPTVKVNGKACVGLNGDKMIFKLAEDKRLIALKLAGARLFEPMPGRAMKEWVAVPLGQVQEDTLQMLAEAALDYVKTLVETEK